jgi:CheY-like chemotaxis protein
VAEDDGVSMRMMGRMLQSNGIRIVQAADGEAAVVAAMTRLPDVILMDCNMPIKVALVLQKLKTLEPVCISPSFGNASI